MWTKQLRVNEFDVRVSATIARRRCGFRRAVARRRQDAAVLIRPNVVGGGTESIFVVSRDCLRGESTGRFCFPHVIPVCEGGSGMETAILSPTSKVGFSRRHSVCDVSPAARPWYLPGT